MYSYTVRKAYNLSNGLSLIGCEFRGAPYLDSINYGYQPLVSAPAVTKRFFSAWIYLDSVSATYDRSIMSTYKGYNAGFAFYIDNHATDRILSFYTGRQTPGKWTTTNRFALGTWTHVAVYYDSSSVLNDPVFYVDGVSVAVTEAITPALYLVSETGLDLHIGNWDDASAIPAAFDGVIKDARIYDMDKTVTTHSDLAAGLYAEGAGGALYYDGMVFQAFSVRTEELASYEDLVLTDEKLLDAYTCNVGTPIGSPTTRFI